MLHHAHRIRPAMVAAAALMTALLTACATKINPPVAGFTCCNLHTDGGWISSDNSLSGKMVPAGSTVRLDSVKRRVYVYGSINGEGVGMRDDSAENLADTMAWLRQVVVSEDPRPQLATWPAEIRAAVQYGRVVIGMSRAQVAMALGYPSRRNTPDPAAPSWRYWSAQGDLVDLQFSATGTLEKISGEPAAVQSVEAVR